MRHPLLLVMFICCVTWINASAQTVTLSTTPRQQEMKGYDVIYKVRASVTGNFKATLFVRVIAPTLPGMTTWLTGSMFNAPYTDSIDVHVQVSGLKTGGDHEIYIEAYNGPLLVRDTVLLTIPGTSAWRIFTSENSPLLNDTVSSITVDRTGLGWIPSNKGLVNFDGTTWNTFTTTNSGIPTNNVFCVSVDSANGVWLGTDSGLVELRNNIWAIHRPADTALAIPVRALTVDDNGTVWVMYESKPPAPNISYLLKFDGTTWTPFITKDQNMFIEWADRLVVDKQQAMWISSWRSNAPMVGGSGGVTQFDGTYWTVHDAIDASLDPNGDVWIISPTTIAKFVDGDRIDLPAYLSVDPVKIEPIRITIDQAGNVWITSLSPWDAHRHGLVRHNGSQSWFYTIGNSALPSEHILTTKVDVNNTLWIGTRKGLALLDANLAPLKAFTTSVDEQSILGHTPLVTNIAPLPVAGEANVVLNLSSAAHVQISVLNILGQEVLNVCNRLFDEGAASVPLDATTLHNGAYLLQTTVAGVREVRTFVVQR